MKKILSAPLILLLVISIFGTSQSAQARSSVWEVLPAKQDKVDAPTSIALGQLKAGETITVIVTLNKQTDLSQVKRTKRAARQQAVIQALQATANTTQVQLKQLLNLRKTQGSVKKYISLWVFNGFSVTATGNVVNELAQQPDVYSITSDDLQIVPSVYGNPEPNISLVNAPALWSLGRYGQGIVVASMDSGVDISHPDLSTRWRGGANSWYDPYNQHPITPTDLSGHGTWTTGIMVGGDAGGTTIGVAPDAKWIAVKIFNDQGGSTATAIHQGFQWLLDPDGNPGTADAPNVVNNSWTYANPGCNLDFQPDLQSLRAAGILPIFAAGNGGPLAGTSFSPANNPSAFAVGAVNNNSQIYGYSSRGPTTCGGSTGPFPELVAPGVNVRTTGLYGSYYINSGTSFAAPHVAGGLALILSAYPDLSAANQEQALINSASDVGASGPDDVFGYGLLNIFSAYNWISINPTPTFMPTDTPTSTPTDTPTSTSTPTIIPTETPTSTPTNTPTAIPTDTATSTPLPTSTPGTTNSVHVGDLDASSVTSGSRWNATVIVTVHDAFENLIQGATVNGNWSNGATGSGSCTTGSNGACSIIRTNLKTSVATVKFTVSSLAAGNPYQSSANHDPDGDSNGTVIIVSNAPTSTSTSTPTFTLTSMATSTPLPTSTPGTTNSVHVGDLDASSVISGSRWNATVIVTVHDAFENPVQGATVNGNWSNGTTGSGSCTTGSDGTCSIIRTNLRTSVATVKFTISSLAAGNPYQPSINHDPDGDSNGTVITVSKP